MGTWSIELPSSHPLASIDQTGKVTFQPHTEMTSYTIKFAGTTAETKCEQTEIRGNIVVYPCTSTTMCTYSVMPTGNKVPSTASSTKVKVGMWTTGGTCSNLSWTFTNYEGENFLTDFEVRADGFVYASVSKDNPSSVSRYAKYEAKATSSSGVKSSPSHFAVEQEGKGAPPASNCPVITNINSNACVPSGSSGAQLASFNTDKDVSTMIATCPDTSMTGIHVDGHAPGRTYTVHGTYPANNTSSIKIYMIEIWCDSTKSQRVGLFALSQFPNV